MSRQGDKWHIDEVVNIVDSGFESARNVAAKLAAYRARIDEVPQDVSHFLEFLQRAVEAEPHAV